MKKRNLVTIFMAVFMVFAVGLVFAGCEDKDDGAEDTAASEVQEEVTEEHSDFDSSLLGDYYDSVSQRATMSIVSSGDDDYNITIMWSSSDSETTKWIMEGEIEGNRLEYDDCVKTDQVVDENGDVVSEEIAYSDGEGYFTIEGGKLLWAGAQDDFCRECCFEMMND